jgi:hypothetical protein
MARSNKFEIMMLLRDGRDALSFRRFKSRVAFGVLARCR